MKAFVTLCFVLFTSSVFAQLNFVSTKDYAFSVNFSFDKVNNANSFCVMSIPHKIPFVGSITGTRLLLDKQLLVVSSLDSKDKTLIYFSFGQGFKTLSMYDADFKPVADFVNDSKLLDRIISSVKKDRVTVYDLF